MTILISSAGEKIRIIYLINHLGLGGSERQLYLLLKHLDKGVFEPSVVVFNPSPHLVLNDALEDVGVKVYEMPGKCSSIPSRSLYLYRLFRDISPHIVHSWTLHDNPYAGLVGGLAGVPIRMGSVRDSLVREGFQRLNRLFRSLSINSTKTLVVNAMALWRELHERGLSDQRIAVIHNCVESEPMATIAEKGENGLASLGIHEGSRIIGMVGNLRMKKNPLMFVDSLAKILPEFPDVHGIMVGQSIPDESDLSGRIETRISEHGLTGRIFLLGFQGNVPALMYRLSIFCLTSFYEGMPNVILEAMAAARPVVATRVGGVPELVEDGVTGYLIEPGDVDGFASAVRRLLDDPGLAEKMGRAGREKIEREFGCEQAVQRLADLYMNALKAKGIYRH